MVVFTCCVADAAARDTISSIVAIIRLAILCDIFGQNVRRQLYSVKSNALSSAPPCQSKISSVMVLSVGAKSLTPTAT